MPAVSPSQHSRENAVAVLTGGTGGLGREVAKRLAATGHRLAISYLIPEEANEVEEILGLDEDRLILKRVDCTDGEAVSAFMKGVEDAFGGINALIALVGGWAGGSDVEDTDDVRYERMLDLNLRTAFNAARAALPALRRAEWGRIVMIGSRAAIDPPASQAMYNVAKAGVIALARTIAEEVNDSNVTANVVLPALIDTPVFREVVPFANYVDWPTPDEIAAVIEFLASPDASVVSGAMVPVYGKS
jgi:NAD(P)-dependent dehydrogenase (short-subunit alcohol dehydrogenase family)